MEAEKLKKEKAGNKKITCEKELETEEQKKSVRMT